MYNSIALFYIGNNDLWNIKMAFILFNCYQLYIGSVKNVVRSTNVIYLQEELTLFFFSSIMILSKSTANKQPF